MEHYLKRPLSRLETIRFKDSNKRNSDIKNIYIVTLEERNSHNTSCGGESSISIEKVKEIIKLKNDGLNHTKISEIVGVSDTTVRTISIEHYNKEKDIYELWNLSKLGKKYNYVKEPKSKISKKKVDRIIEFRNKGMNYSDISRRLEISNMTVRKYCIENNV